MRKLLWIDCTAGAVVGVAVLTLSAWLSRVEALPREILLFTGAANLLYACYSLSLAMRVRRSRRAIELLVIANGAWSVVCVALAVSYASSATWFGIAHLAGEAAFVGALAACEWRCRAELAAGR
ncbi:MAG TPA: hypothetical protein VE010_01335 [Thermoanaerobaculia bacterium]|nr:hypothetical protein [Thermoanaerobaculia bacterium]